MKTIPAMTTTTGIKRKGMKVSEEIVDKTMSVALIAAAAHCAREQDNQALVQCTQRA